MPTTNMPNPRKPALLLFISLTAFFSPKISASCLSREDTDKCQAGNRDCWGEFYSGSNDFLGIKCHEKACFKFNADTDFSETSRECIRHFSMLNFSHCSSCDIDSFDKPLQFFHMVPVREEITRVLDLSANGIKGNQGTLEGPCERVSVLYLSQNRIQSLDSSGIGLDACQNLTEVWLDQNNLKSFDLTRGTSLPRLGFMSVRGNQDLKQLDCRAFLNLSTQFPNLKVLDLADSLEKCDFYDFYSILTKMMLEKVYWSKDSITCNCAIVKSISRDLGNLRVVYGQRKPWLNPHSGATWNKLFESPDLVRFQSYYIDEREVVCDQHSDIALQNKTLSSDLIGYCSSSASHVRVALLVAPLALLRIILL